MTTARFYSIDERWLASSMEMLNAAFGAGDLNYWAKLYAELERLSPLPRFGFGRLDLTRDVPLTRIDHYFPPGAGFNRLSPAHLPDLRDRTLGWLLREATLQCSHARLTIGWDRFSYGFAVSIREDGMIDSAAEEAEFQLIVGKIFYARETIPEQFWFLRNADQKQAYLTVAKLGETLDVEQRVGLLQRLAAHYQASDSPLMHGFGEGLAELYHFLQLMRLEGLCVLYCEDHT